MSKKRIALIGGGQIGGNLALLAAQKELGDIVIFDIPKAEGMVKGKALDLMQLRPHDGYDVDNYWHFKLERCKRCRRIYNNCWDPKKTWNGQGRFIRY